MSLGAAAKLSGLDLGDFIEHLTSLDIDILARDETTVKEEKDIRAWLV